MNIKSTLTPGASDLIIDVTPGKLVTGSVDADNAGSRYTREYRGGGTVNLNNLAGRGDVASLRALTSFDGLNYGRGAYQMRFGKVATSTLRNFATNSKSPRQSPARIRKRRWAC